MKFLNFILFLGILIHFQKNKGQSTYEYSFGIDNKGNYGISINQGNENRLLQFNYTSFNFSGISKKNTFLSTQTVSLKPINSIGLAYYKQNQLTPSLNFYYGSSINMANLPFENLPGNSKYLTNINLQIGLKYKLSENLSIGAEFRHGYGNYWYNTLIQPNFFSSSYHSSWLNW